MSHKILTPGETHDRVPKLKSLLIKWLNGHGHKAVAKKINPTSKRYGAAAARGVRIFQAAKGLEVDAIVGPKTWAALTGAKPKPKGKRALMKEWMTWALRHEPSFHYRQSRPIPLRAMKAKQLPIYSDCSGTSTGCHYYAGAKDPNGRNYDGSGYTGTVRSASEQISLSEAKVGDMIVYGRGTGAHMVMIYSDEGSQNPLCWSHGQESGPRLYRHAMYVGMHGYFTVHRAKV